MNVKGVFSHKSDDWYTPDFIYKRYVVDCGYFDPCPLKADFDGLALHWPRNVFCNPPYSNIKAFILKGIEFWNEYQGSVVFLLPVRTDTEWFKIVSDFGCDIRFIRGRLKFGGSKSGAPFPSMLLSINGFCSCMDGRHTNKFYVTDLKYL